MAGEFIVERPTLICLGFEWKISGDHNRDSSVDVSYRKAGESAWRKGMPLLRMGDEQVFRRDSQRLPAPFLRAWCLSLYFSPRGEALGIANQLELTQREGRQELAAAYATAFDVF